MKIYKLLPLLMLALVSSCADDAFVEIVDPVQTGEEIRFTPVLPKESSTRTIYGDDMETGADGSRYYPVYWVNEKDSILILCPQASAPVSRSVQYKVQAGENQNVASAVVKVGDVGLQWGAQDEHKFYALYPSSTALNNQTSQGTVMTNIANVQRPIKTKQVGNRFIVYPDMTHAVMSAYGSFKKSELTQNSTVDLHFTPQMTALEVVVKGPASGQPIQLTSIVVSDANHQPICGDYVFKMDELGNMTWKSASEGVVNSQIIIPCENIKLGANQEAVFKVFMSPDADEVGKIVPKVTVNTLNGSKTKTLNHTTLAPHKIARAILPNLVAGSNYWMSNLDPNIYISELSYPGSKMSFLTRYQTAKVAEQFAEGVRAFIIQTNIRTVNNSQQLVVASEYGSVKNPETNSYVPVTEVLPYLVNCIKDAQSKKAMQEFVFVMFTYCGTGSEDATVEVERTDRPGRWRNQRISAGQNWMRLLRETCKKMAEDPNYKIYTPEVTADTKISDVAGKIILKANYNGDEMYVKYRGATENVPLMLSDWIGAYPQSNPDYADGVPLYWGNMKNAAKMKWFYQEVTTVSTDGSGAEATYSEKLQYVKNIFEKSIDLYKTGTLHDTWFVNDLGGRLTDNGIVDDVREEKLAEKINPEATKILQKRNADASLGLIFMNFADRRSDSGQKFGSDWLIQTVIDNNFKFPLRKEDTGTASYAPTRVGADDASDDEWDK